MHLIDGQSLTQGITAGPLPVSEVLDLGRRLTDVLTYVHHHGIVHRDVKPSNILLDGEGEMFLADFGISRLVDTRSELTATGMTVGTFAYRAPDQVRGSASARPPMCMPSDWYCFNAMSKVLLASRLARLRRITYRNHVIQNGLQNALARRHHIRVHPPTSTRPPSSRSVRR